MKTIELKLEPELEKVQEIIGSVSSAGSANSVSHLGSERPAMPARMPPFQSSPLRRESLYDLVRREFTPGVEGVRLPLTYVEAYEQGKEAFTVLRAYEQAVAVFRAASLELRKDMDILALEQKLGAQQRALEEQQVLQREPAAGQIVPQDSRETRQQGLPNESNGVCEADEAGGISEADEAGKYGIGSRKEKAPIKISGKGAAEVDELKRHITEAVMFSNRYALYFAGHVGLALLNSEKADVKNRFSFGTKWDASTERDELTSMLVRVAIRDLQRVIRDSRGSKARNENTNQGDAELKTGEPKTGSEKNQTECLTYTQEAIFTSWINQFNWKTWEGTAAHYGIDGTRLKSGKFSLESGEFKKKYDVITITDRIMPVHREDIIGNREFKKTVWQYLLRLAGYDFERRTNPWNPPQTVFTFGHPGCGKTMGYDALARSFAETVCRPRGIPVTVDVLSIERFGSEYKDKAPLQLAAYRDQIAHDPGLWVMRASDIDTFMPASRAGGLTQEESKLNGVFFSFFDGSVIQRNGRYLALLDANHIDNMDPALKSRLAAKIELPRFDKAEDFAAIAKFYLAHGREGVPVSGQEWAEVGEYLLHTELSNREISNVMSDLAGSFEIEEDMIGLPYERRVDVVVAYNQGINKTTVMGAFEKYITTTMEIERKSREAKIKQRIEQYKMDLATALDDSPAGSGAIGQ